MRTCRVDGLAVGASGTIQFQVELDLLDYLCLPSRTGQFNGLLGGDDGPGALSLGSISCIIPIVGFALQASKSGKFMATIPNRRKASKGRVL